MPTLLILDNDRLPGVLREELLAHNYSIVELRSGKNALEFIGAASPDLILFGIDLREAEGLEIFREIRKSCDIPLIVLCARECEQECALALDLGADDCVSEPLARKELLARIRVQLRRSCRDKEMTVSSRRRDRHRLSTQAGDSARPTNSSSPKTVRLAEVSDRLPGNPSITPGINRACLGYRLD